MALLAASTVTLALCLLALGLVAQTQTAAAKPLDPPPGRTFTPKGKKMYHGVSDTTRLKDFQHFRRSVKHHPAVMQVFYHWDVDLEFSGAFDRWKESRTLGMVSLSTKNPATGEASMPLRRIARGHVDRFIVRLNRQVVNHGRPVYYRLFPEMNGHWNPYSAYNQNGTKRGKDYSQRNFIRAWRRIVIITRGGTRAQINKRLLSHGLPRIHRAKSDDSPIYSADGTRVPKRLGRAPITFMWVPQTFGSPNIRGNQPANYWPGKKFVDWVGADIFAKFQTAFPHLDIFYKKYAVGKNKPFVIGEYSPWDNDHQGRFTERLLRWGMSKSRVRMLVYYRSVTKGTSNPHYISKYPRAKRALRKHLTKKRFAQFAPGMKNIHRR